MLAQSLTVTKLVMHCTNGFFALTVAKTVSNFNRASKRRDNLQTIRYPARSLKNYRHANRFSDAPRKSYRRAKKRTEFPDGAFNRRKKKLNFSRDVLENETLDGKRGNYRDKASFPTPRGASSNTILTQRKRKKKPLQENKI